MMRSWQETGSAVLFAELVHHQDESHECPVNMQGLGGLAGKQGSTEHRTEAEWPGEDLPAGIQQRREDAYGIELRVALREIVDAEGGAPFPTVDGIGFGHRVIVGIGESIQSSDRDWSRNHAESVLPQLPRGLGGKFGFHRFRIADPRYNSPIRGGTMCDQDHFESDRQEFEKLGLVTRKQFGALLGAGIAMMLPPVANAVTVTESDVNVTTPDGTADCYFVHPSSGTAPGVLVWPDIFGLRPAFRNMGKRLAESGYAVLVVNPFYRTKKAPTADAGGATPIQQVMPLARTLSETTHMSDAKAFIAWLDGQKPVAKNRKMGTQGYCMGGPIAFRTAAAVPDRVGAVASFHGAPLVTDQPNSPHLQAAKSKAQFLIAIAANDDARSPNDKTTLKDTMAQANLQAEIEVYTGAAHGWCPPDSTVYNEPLAEKAWGRLLALYGKALA